MSELHLSDKESKRFPQRGDTDYLTPAETAFVERIFGQPVSFPQSFWTAVLQKVVLDIDKIPSSQIVGGRAGLWQSYDPVWTSSSGTAPSIGNGQLLGRFSRSTKTVSATIFLSGGSTTSWGTTGAWKFSNPIPVSEVLSVSHGSGRAFDDSAGSPYLLGLTTGSDGITPYTGTQPGDFLSSTSPFTWATSDNLILSITYEAA